jgi:hypothetical protein
VAAEAQRHSWFGHVPGVVWVTKHAQPAAHVAVCPPVIATDRARVVGADEGLLAEPWAELLSDVAARDAGVLVDLAFENRQGRDQSRTSALPCSAPIAEGLSTPQPSRFSIVQPQVLGKRPA